MSLHDQYLNSIAPQVNDPLDEPVDEEPRHFFSVMSPKGTRVFSTNVRLVQQVRVALWPPSHKTKLPRNPINMLPRLPHD